MEYLTLIFWSLIGSVASLIGGVVLIKMASLRKTVITYALPFGAGALLAAGFLGLLPEAIELGDMHTVGYWVLGGFLTFFILERLLGWFHHHHHHDDVDGDAKDKTHIWLVIIGDTLHNAIDGVAIGAAFLINPALGIGTAIAVAAHEIPQEIGDFGILLGKKMAPRKVIIVNLLSSLATVVTAVITFALGSSMAIDTSALLAIAAGFFIYIAASDIIPEIHETPREQGNRQSIMLLIGVVVLATVIALTPHSHGDGSHHGHDHSGHNHGAEMHKDHDHDSHDEHSDHDDHGHETHGEKDHHDDHVDKKDTDTHTESEHRHDEDEHDHHDHDGHNH